MKPKLVLLCIAALSVVTPSQAQILKKIKDKVNKTINNATETESSAAEEETSTTAPSSTAKEKEKNQENKYHTQINHCLAGKWAAGRQNPDPRGSRSTYPG